MLHFWPLSDLAEKNSALGFVQVMTQEGSLVNLPQGCQAVDENSSVSICPKVWVEPTFTLAAKVRVILTFCFFMLAACSNSAVLYSVTRKRRRSHVQLLILSLTVADLLVTVLVMPLDAVWNVTVQWYAGDALCKLLNFLKLFAMYSAALVLVVISLDRHAAILHPFSFANSSHRNRIMLWVAWILSALLASPQVGNKSGWGQSQANVYHFSFSFQIASPLGTETHR